MLTEMELVARQHCSKSCRDSMEMLAQVVDKLHEKEDISKSEQTHFASYKQLHNNLL